MDDFGSLIHLHCPDKQVIINQKDAAPVAAEEGNRGKMGSSTDPRGAWGFPRPRRRGIFLNQESNQEDLTNQFFPVILG